MREYVHFVLPFVSGGFVVSLYVLGALFLLFLGIGSVSWVKDKADRLVDEDKEVRAGVLYFAAVALTVLWLSLAVGTVGYLDHGRGRILVEAQ